MKVYFLPWFALAVLALPGTAGATVLYSNLANPNSSAFAGISSSNFATTSFSTDNNSYTLTDIMIPLQAVPSGGEVFVNLVTDNGGVPGTNIGTLGHVFDTSLSTTSFTTETISGGGLLLSPNTTYFVLLEGISDTQNDAYWEMASTNTATGITGSVAGIEGTSVTIGQSWTLNTASASHPPFELQVDVTQVAATPEPGSLSAMLAGLSAILAARLRRKS